MGWGEIRKTPLKKGGETEFGLFDHSLATIFEVLYFLASFFRAEVSQTSKKSPCLALGKGGLHTFSLDVFFFNSIKREHYSLFFATPYLIQKLCKLFFVSDDGYPSKV